MKNLVGFFGNFRTGNECKCSKLNPVANVEPIIINYNGIKVKAKKLTTTANPNDYQLRLLLNFKNGFKSDILFIQGLSDSPIQMYSWRTFKEDVLSSTNCQIREFTEILSGGHVALFESPIAKAAFNKFISGR